MPRITKEIVEFIEKHGDEPVLNFIENYKEGKAERLTIVVSRGVHHIPKNFLYENVYYFSEGTLDIEHSDPTEFLRRRLLHLARKLKSRQWREVSIVPTGHPAFSMHVMLLVFRITRLEPKIVAYFGADGYRMIALEQRPILSGRINPARLREKTG